MVQERLDLIFQGIRGGYGCGFITCLSRPIVIIKGRKKAKESTIRFGEHTAHKQEGAEFAQ